MHVITSLAVELTEFNSYAKCHRPIIHSTPLLHTATEGAAKSHNMQKLTDSQTIFAGQQKLNQLRVAALCAFVLRLLASVTFSTFPITGLL